MKNVLGFGIDALLAALVALAVVPMARETVHWTWAQVVRTPSALESFLATWPEGKHVEDAITLHDGALWQQLASSMDPVPLEAYVRSARRDTHKRDALKRADELRFKEAMRIDTPRALQIYRDTHPDSVYATQARLRQDLLLMDMERYEIARDQADLAVINKFLADYPGHMAQSKAEQAARDIAGRSVFDLLHEKRIKLNLSAVGAETAQIVLTSSSEHPLVVRIAPGTLLVPRLPGAPRLMTTREGRILLEHAAETHEDLDVVALQVGYQVPMRLGAYRLAESRKPTPLSRLAATLAEADAPRMVKQVAAWIVSSNAGLTELARMARRTGLNAPATTDVAQAMRLVDKSGLDVRARAIWRERAKVSKGLADIDLKQWIESR